MCGLPLNLTPAPPLVSLTPGLPSGLALGRYAALLVQREINFMGGWPLASRARARFQLDMEHLPARFGVPVDPEVGELSLPLYPLLLCFLLLGPQGHNHSWLGWQL